MLCEGYIYDKCGSSIEESVVTDILYYTNIQLQQLSGTIESMSSPNRKSFKTKAVEGKKLEKRNIGDYLAIQIRSL